MIRRLDFLSIVILVIAVNWFIFNPLFLPREDAKTKLEIFYFFYNTVLQHGVWPLWMPLNTFGQPAQIWQWIGLTPAHFAAIVAGKVFHVTDIPWLFKICLLLNDLFFVTGLYLLGRLLWSNRFITWVLCLGCGLFHNWFTDLDMKLHVFYFLPWLLWLIIRFFQTGRSWSLWLVPIGLIVWMMGNCLYYLFLWGWLLVIFTAVLWWQQRRTFRPEFTSPLSRLALAAMLIVLAAFWYHFHHYTAETFDMQRPGGGKNPLWDFMTYGPVFEGSWETLVNYFVLGISKDHYLPTALSIFAVWAIFFVRRPVAVALLAMTGALVFFSFKGWFTYFSYILPFLSYFHDAGNTYGLIVVLVALLAGYGLDDFFHTEPSLRWRRLGWIAFGTFVFVDGLGFTRNYAAIMFAHGRDPLAELLQFPWGWRLTALMIVAIISAIVAHMPRFRNASLVWTKVGLGLWILLDIAAYGRDVLPTDIAKFYWEPQQRTYWNAMPQSYVPMRTPDPVHERDRQLWSMFSKDTAYVCLYSMMDFDICWPLRARVDFITKRLSNLMNVNVPAQITGCMQPKLRFMPQATTVGTMQEALNMVHSSGLDAQKPIIETKELFPAADNTSGSFNAPQILSYNPNHLKLRFNAPSSGWLTYADNWNPGWKATINGESTKVYPADISFKAIRVAHAGETIIDLNFMPFADGIICLGWVILGTAVGFLLLGIFSFTFITSLVSSKS